MKTQQLLLAALGGVLFAIPANGQETITDVLNDRSLNMKLLPDRAKAVQRIKAIEDRNLKNAKALAKALGKPIEERLPSGKVRWVQEIDENGELVYYETRNVNAAISTGANIINSSPYNINGSGIRVGVWENDSPRLTHQEFNDGPTSRVNNLDSLAYGDHATHVAGTIAAFGMTPTAKGMANQAVIDAYWAATDNTTMTSAGATGTGQFASKVYVSNHSYGPSYGWESVSGKWTWKGDGTDQNAADWDFGQYSPTSASIDAICYNTPYYLPFWASGNERLNGPSNGTISSIGGVDVAYNSAIHPPYDNNYRNGFETMGDETISKNVLTVGAANDAVTSGLRDPSKATIASFSSTGPTDDGRIKPDLVGNGLSVNSSIATNDTAYASSQGTSMATPNLTGTAALLVALYRDLFAGSAMLSSTLKGLLIHTASDLGNPGPDYIYGWGLLDGKKAAELIKRQADYPALQSIVQAQVTPANPSQSYSFSWDGVSPIRATLCWTDPAGAGESSHDNRTPDLVNNLNLKLIAPNGTEYFPFVMPFVGTWTVASMAQNATTGVNNTDNVEQVLVNTPGQAGAWQVVVSYTGTLTNNLQNYGLIISGAGVAGTAVFNPSSYSVLENAGTATITVSRVGGSTGAVSLDYATSNGTATSGSDYTATSGTLSWSDSEMGNKTFTIPILNDSVAETYAETVAITLSNPIGITLGGTNPAILTINDDETFMGVTSFNSGGTFSTSTSQNITWASSLGGNVRIELLKNGLLYTTISDSTPNDGLFSWTIPTLAPTGNDYSIRITSLAGGGESDVSDGVFSILNVVNSAFYTADMSTDPGWTLQGLWAYGIPTGAAGTHGQRDPTAGFTGSNVIGYNLAGPYENNLVERYATTPAINCSGRSNVQLSFYRWLNVESNVYDNAKILVSNNGTSWVQIFANGSNDMTATSWSLQTYNISAVADGQPTVYIRWVMGTTDVSFQFTGWNIDDVTLTGNASGTNPAGHLAFSSADFQVTENVGSATITVNRTLGTTGAVGVNYSTSNGTATSASDYTATSGTLSWANGDATPKTFSIPITNDSTREDFLESLSLTLTNTVGATLAGTNPATLTIQDDDNLPPTVNAGIDKTVSLSEVVPWSPSETTTALWLDADDSNTITLNGATVSAWADKSGNGRNATQGTATAQPTRTLAGLGGKNVLTFDGSTDVLNVDLDFLAGTSHSAFVVLSNPTAYSNIYGAATSGSGSSSLHVGFSSATNYRMNFWSHDYAPLITSNFVSSGSVLNYVWPVGSSKQIFANGKLEAVGGQVALAPSTMAGGGRIGRTTAHPFLGARIAEIIMVTGTVSAADRERFEGYLAHKWSLTNNLALTHPYKTTAPGGTGYRASVALSDSSVIEPEGDSFTATWSVVGGSPFVTFANPNAVNTTATFTAEGTYVLQLLASDGSSQGSDFVTITVGPPLGALSHFAISPITSPHPVGTAINGITITAQDAANQTVTSFTGTVTFGGTAGITGTSASFVAGVLSGVSVTPAVAGSNLTFTVNDGAGHTGSATFTVQTPYTEWASGFLPVDLSDPAGDHDNDTLTNLQEYAFGTDPTASTGASISYTPGGSVTTPGAPVALNLATGSGVDYRAVFGRRENHEALGLTYTVQFTADMTNWVTSTATPVVLTGTPSAGDIEAVSVPYPFFIPVNGGGFMKPTFFRVGVSGN